MVSVSFTNVIVGAALTVHVVVYVPWCTRSAAGASGFVVIVPLRFDDVAVTTGALLAMVDDAEPVNNTRPVNVVDVVPV